MSQDDATELYNDVLHFAIDAHKGMVRKLDHIPFILHPMEVATIAATMTNDIDVLSAAMLHDVVEDTPHTLSDIEGRFGPRIASLVDVETEDKMKDVPPEQSWRARKEESLARLAKAGREEKILWLSDKLANMRSFYRAYRERGELLWEDFHMRDAAQQAWYYVTVAELCSELRNEAAWQEFSQLIHVVFEGVLS